MYLYDKAFSINTVNLRLYAFQISRWLCSFINIDVIFKLFIAMSFHEKNALHVDSISYIICYCWAHQMLVINSKGVLSNYMSLWLTFNCTRNRKQHSTFASNKSGSLILLTFWSFSWICRVFKNDRKRLIGTFVIRHSTQCVRNC